MIHEYKNNTKCVALRMIWTRCISTCRVINLVDNKCNKCITNALQSNSNYHKKLIFLYPGAQLSGGCRISQSGEGAPSLGLGQKPERSWIQREDAPLRSANATSNAPKVSIMCVADVNMDEATQVSLHI